MMIKTTLLNKYPAFINSIMCMSQTFLPKHTFISLILHNKEIWNGRFAVITEDTALRPTLQVDAIRNLSMCLLQYFLKYLVGTLNTPYGILLCKWVRFPRWQRSSINFKEAMLHNFRFVFSLLFFIKDLYAEPLLTSCLKRLFCLLQILLIDVTLCHLFVCNILQYCDSYI